MDQRLRTLRSWIEAVTSVSSFELDAATGDASLRRYFRVRLGGESYIAMDAPPAHYDTGVYVRIAKRLLALGLNVPRVLTADLARGFLLLSDLGEETYLAALSEHSADRLYGDALATLQRLQQGTRDDGFLPPYERSLLLSEIGLFGEWYLDRYLGLQLTRAQKRVLDESAVMLAEAALAQPRVWVHRDFHSRNLMVTDEHNPGVLDFQDAVVGPVSYDLVSLLRDCYVEWPEERVLHWIDVYRANAGRAGVPVGKERKQFLRWFDLMGVQRHLKAIGIFARLQHRDAKPGYLEAIPRTLAYLMRVSARYPELGSLHRLLQELALPEARAPR